MNLLGEETNIFLHGHAVLAVVSDTLGRSSRKIKVIKTSRSYF